MHSCWNPTKEMPLLHSQLRAGSWRAGTPQDGGVYTIFFNKLKITAREEFVWNCIWTAFWAPAQQSPPEGQAANVTLATMSKATDLATKSSQGAASSFTWISAPALAPCSLLCWCDQLCSGAINWPGQKLPWLFLPRVTFTELSSLILLTGWVRREMS